MQYIERIKNNIKTAQEQKNTLEQIETITSKFRKIKDYIRRYQDNSNQKTSVPHRYKMQGYGKESYGDYLLQQARKLQNELKGNDLEKVQKLGLFKEIPTVPDKIPTTKTHMELACTRSYFSKDKDDCNCNYSSSDDDID